MKPLLLALCALLTPAAASAGDLTLTVRDAAGLPVPDAVVTVYPAAGAPKTGFKFAWPLRVSQHDLQFDPFVLVSPVGADVAFPNQDKVRHHVYSFSPGNRFELKLYGKEDSRTVAFKSVGVVAIGCNIHDQMVGFIKVVDTPYAIKTGADGVAVIANIPGGAATLRVWHPALKAVGNEIAAPLTVPAQGMLSQDSRVELRPTAPRQKGGTGMANMPGMH
jgi:plastocyanin